MFEGSVSLNLETNLFAHTVQFAVNQGMQTDGDGFLSPLQMLGMRE